MSNQNRITIMHAQAQAFKPGILSRCLQSVKTNSLGEYLINTHGCCMFFLAQAIKTIFVMSLIIIQI